MPFTGKQTDDAAGVPSNLEARPFDQPTTRAAAPKLPFDLVVLDLDGTILDLYRHAPVSEAVTRAITAVQAAGIPVTIATGRTLDYVRQHITHLGLTAPVVTTQGAVVGDPVTGQILLESTIPLPLARQAVAWLDDQPHVSALYFNGDALNIANLNVGNFSDDTINDNKGHIHIYQNRVGDDIAFLDHVFGFPRTIHTPFTSLLVAEAARPPLKFIVVEDRERYGVDVAAELRSRFTPGLTITRTHPRLVEGTAEGIDKGLGVLHLCRLLNIDPQRVLAIGDSDNDIPMIEAVGFGVAMGNSTPGVIAAARYLAPSIENDGVAVALGDLILKKL